MYGLQVYHNEPSAMQGFKALIYAHQLFPDTRSNKKYPTCQMHTHPKLTRELSFSRQSCTDQSPSASFSKLLIGPIGGKTVARNSNPAAYESLGTQIYQGRSCRHCTRSNPCLQFLGTSVASVWCRRRWQLDASTQMFPHGMQMQAS
jgi:hypothetical protein